jgi:polysaccharide export outer membrane protein
MPNLHRAGFVFICLLYVCGTTASSDDSKTIRPVPASSEETRDARSAELGPGDQIQLSVYDAEGVDGKTYRIGHNGEIKVPLVGYVNASGLTVRELETELTQRLAKFYRKPQVTASIIEQRSQPVSVIGSVNNPGVQQLQGKKTLVEVLAMAGGLRADAGPVAKITRKSEWGMIPLPGAEIDEQGYSVAEIRLRSVMTAENPEHNIVIRPHDIISVPRADMVYVLGEVPRAGGFPLNERETMTVLQALSLAGGLTPVAKAKEARILRNNADTGGRTEMAINVKAIVSGSRPDVPLESEDILFIPTSTSKRVIARTVEAAIQAATGMAIWRSAQ